MIKRKTIATTALGAAIGLLTAGSATATEPCGDFGECKVLVEINSSDGDIGFHFLMDDDELCCGAARPTKCSLLPGSESMPTSNGVSASWVPSM